MRGDRNLQSDRRLGVTRFFVPDSTFGWFMRAIGLGSLGIGAFFGALSCWYHQRLLMSLGILEVLDEPGVREMVSQFALYSGIITAIAAVGTVLFVSMLSLFLIHRITGPIYRLKQHMLGMTMGQPPREVAFRKDDQLASLSAAFNEFARHFGLIEARPVGAAEPDEQRAERQRAVHAHAGT